MTEPVPFSADTSRIYSAGGVERPGSVDRILPLVYDELRQQAHRYLRRERQGHTLQTTDLINEVYLRLIDQRNTDWESRAHFFAVAANMMRRILVDYARTRHRVKRGGHLQQVELEAETVAAKPDDGIDLIALDQALDRLFQIDEQQGRIVEMRYFAGMNNPEIAEILGISESTVRRDWNVARAWLRYELSR